MEQWRRAMLKGPSRLGRAARGVQTRINRAIPEKVHAVVTATIERLTRVIVTGSDLTTARALTGVPLSEREAKVRLAIAAYRRTAAAEGGVAGAGGFMLALAEFPALLATKIRLLFEIAALYGHDGKALPERLYILMIFQLAYSSAEHRHAVLGKMDGWDGRETEHPRSLEDLDWRRFQQEYRDYIDLAKLAQLLPVVGAPIGVVVNWRLLHRLGETAINAYRMRWFEGR
jgi:hypothetical protein